MTATHALVLASAAVGFVVALIAVGVVALAVWQTRSWRHGERPHAEAPTVPWQLPAGPAGPTAPASAVETVYRWGASRAPRGYPPPPPIASADGDEDPAGRVVARASVPARSDRGRHRVAPGRTLAVQLIPARKEIRSHRAPALAGGVR